MSESGCDIYKIILEHSIDLAKQGRDIHVLLVLELYFLKFKEKRS